MQLKRNNKILQLLHLIILLTHTLVPCVTAEPQYQRLAAATASHNDQTDWQPMQNNWIILHTSPAQLQHYPYNSFNQSGNYHEQKYVAPKKLKVVEPYVLAISKVPDATNPFFTTRRKQPIPLSSVSNKFRRNIFEVLPEKTEKLSSTQDIDKDIEKNMLHISEAATPTVTSVNVDISDSAATATDTSDVEDVEQTLSDFLVPLENAIDKVRQFCDLAKNIISDVDDDEVSIASSFASLMPSDSTVQGRANIASSKQRTSSTFVGTGRKSKKLKKKFKKFLLPLLLAYKLKFLTLIPVLIGGLTLLVGSTGLAGFFFALFTAVMSLKSSGGAKTIVVKKI